jgi:hypothetical protein
MSCVTIRRNAFIFQLVHVSQILMWCICSHTKCTSTQLTTQQTKHSLNLHARFKHLHCLTCHMLVLWWEKDWTVEVKPKHENYYSQNPCRNPYSRTNDIFLWCHIALNNSMNISTQSFPLPLLHINAFTDETTVPQNLNINILLKPKKLLTKYDAMYSRIQIL